ncbi:MAG: protoporphyrinogen oxidase HemJ [Alphaproteobacteria bacterium]|nr:protoporphyrinogen oxidase HemJ [Alphaproteobacteria bacterium]
MTHDVIKALHIISVIAWMAGMLYLPRLYVYHADAAKGSDKSETFKVMERRLLRIIINPAMIAAWLFGVWMILLNPALLEQGWLHAKLALLAGMQVTHALFARWRRDFEHDRNTRPAKFYRMVNEVPTLLLIGIVLLAVIKPF